MPINISIYSTVDITENVVDFELLKTRTSEILQKIFFEIYQNWLLPAYF